MKSAGPEEQRRRLARPRGKGPPWLLGILALSACDAGAQELEPRKYSNLPVGTNVLAAGYAWSNGNVLLDPALPIENLDANIQVGFVTFVHSFGLLARNAKLAIMIPWSNGDWSGSLEGDFENQKTSGLGDAHVGLEWILVGAPALDAAQFGSHVPGLSVGASLRLSLPTGRYNSADLLNLGSNRYTLRTELGIANSQGRWTWEALGAIWFFTDNGDFLEGSTLSQRPLYVGKADVVYSFRRAGMWASFGVGFGEGGQTRVDGVARNTQQNNWRFSAAFAYPVGGGHALRLTYTTGITRKAGSDFDTIALAYQYAWGD